MEAAKNRLYSILLTAAILLSLTFALAVPGASADDSQGEIQTIFTGRSTSFALMSDGSLWAWGNNSSGQLGDGTNTNRTAPVLLSISDVKAVAGGLQHTLALKNDGTVWAWGSNGNGQLGDGTTTSSYVPVPVSGLSGITAVSTGPSFSMALKDDGTVWTWGDNYRGQLGDGTNTSRTAPVPVSGLSGITAVSAGPYSGAAVDSDGAVWTWGDNSFGQLGDDSIPDRNSPVQIGITDVLSVSGGNQHFMALKTDGTVWAWGNNDSGQLGSDSTTGSPVPVQVPGLSDITAISAGERHSLALKDDGTVWAWGDNSSGQLGNDSMTDHDSPEQISVLSGITAVSAGERHSLALKTDGTVWTWGNNDSGQLGNSTTVSSHSPLQALFANAPAPVNNSVIRDLPKQRFSSTGTPISIVHWPTVKDHQVIDNAYTAEASKAQNGFETNSHVIVTDKVIRFLGYYSPAYLDMVYTDEYAGGFSSMTFIQRPVFMDFHTFTETGFLFNGSMSVDDNAGVDTATYTGYALILQKQGTTASLMLYYINGETMNCAGFVPGTNSRTLIDTFKTGIADKSSDPYKIQVDRDPSTGAFSIYIDGVLSADIDNVQSSGDGFGFYTGYYYHTCSSLTIIQYENASVVVVDDLENRPHRPTSATVDFYNEAIPLQTIAPQEVHDTWDIDPALAPPIGEYFSVWPPATIVDEHGDSWNFVYSIPANLDMIQYSQNPDQNIIKLYYTRVPLAGKYVTEKYRLWQDDSTPLKSDSKTQVKNTSYYIMPPSRRVDIQKIDPSGDMTSYRYYGYSTDGGATKIAGTPPTYLFNPVSGTEEVILYFITDLVPLTINYVSAGDKTTVIHLPFITETDSTVPYFMPAEHISPITDSNGSVWTYTGEYELNSGTAETGNSPGIPKNPGATFSAAQTAAASSLDITLYFGTNHTITEKFHSETSGADGASVIQADEVTSVYTGGAFTGSPPDEIAADGGYTWEYIGYKVTDDSSPLIPDDIPEIHSASSDMVFIYVYRSNAPTFTVTFDGNEGTVLPEDLTRVVTAPDTELGSNMPPDPTRDGYTFDGWNTNPDGSGTSFTDTTTITGDITVYAQWSPVSTPPPPSSPPTSSPTPYTPPPEAPPQTTEIFTDEHIWYIRGYEDHTVNPDGSITRAEVALVFYRLLEDDLKDFIPDPTFDDVTGDEWYGQAVNLLAYYNILNGYTDGEFKPDQPVTRNEMAAIASRFDELEETSDNPYKDLDPDNWAYMYVLAATKNGWFIGDNAGLFRPDDDISRAELVTMVNRILNRYIQPEDIPRNAAGFDDLPKTHWAYAAFMEAVHTHDFKWEDSGNSSKEWWTKILSTGFGNWYNR